MPAFHPLCRLMVGALSLVAVLAAVGGTASAAGEPADVIAQAGAITLAGPDIRALVASLPANERLAATSDLGSLQQVIQASLVRRALLAEANASGFDRQPATLAQLDRAREDALLRLWLASKASVPASYPTEAEVQAAYQANQQALASPTQYRLAQIFVSAPDGGEPSKLSAALLKVITISSRVANTDFSTLARQQSEDSASAGGGGELGFVAENRLVPAVDSVVRSMTVGQVAGPIKTQQGVVFIKLLDRKAGTLPTLAQAHERLVAALRNRRASLLEQTYLTQYSAKLGVTVNQIELARLQQTLAR